MATEYEQWIATNVGGNGYGKCADATKRMREAFPELRLAKGFFHCIWGERCHWWLVAPDGTIVDPTRAQFPGPGEYEELSDEECDVRVPIGKCMNCGEPTYKSSYDACMCSEECGESFASYMNSPVAF